MSACAGFLKSPSETLDSMKEWTNAAVAYLVCRGSQLGWPTFVDYRVKLCGLLQRTTEGIKTRLRLTELE